MMTKLITLESFISWLTVLAQSIANEGVTIILASHMLDEVEKVCSHVAIIKNGNLLVQGSVDEILSDESLWVVQAENMDALQQALLAFDGTLILVSHDRDFLQGLSQKVFEFKDQRVIEHFETIDEFLQKNRMENLKEIDLKSK